MTNVFDYFYLYFWNSVQCVEIFQTWEFWYVTTKLYVTSTIKIDQPAIIKNSRGWLVLEQHMESLKILRLNSSETNIIL